MPRAPRVITPVPPDGDIFAGDDLTDEEIEQASVGDLISIQGPQFDNVSWSIWRHRTRQEMASEHSAETQEWVADRTGQLHGTDLVEAIGGGTFNMRGYVPRADGRGVQLKYNRTIALAGPRRNFSAQPPVPAVVATTPHANGSGELTRSERMMLRIMRNMDARLEKMTSTPPPPAAPPTSLKDLADTLKTLKELSGPEKAQPARDPDKEIVGTYVAMIQQGIALGQERDPVSGGEGGGTDWGKIAETGMQLLDKLLSRAAQQRAQARRGPHPPSSATVVETDGKPVSVTPEPAVQTVANHRWVSAVEKLAGAISSSQEPAEFAADLEVILNEDEIEKLISPLATTEAVLAECSPYFETYPVLTTDAARPYVAAVLAELRNPSEDASLASE